MCEITLTTSPSLLLWLVVALSYCVQRDFERQPFIPFLILSPVNGEFPDLGLACQARWKR